MTKAKTQGNDNNDSKTNDLDSVLAGTDITAKLDAIAAELAAMDEPTTAVIVFTQDYRGVLTNEQYYLKGTAVEFPLSQAASLVEAGRATYKD